MNFNGVSRARYPFRILAIVAVLIASGTTGRSQDSDEVTALKKEIELLKKENELLKKEVELLKKDGVESKPPKLGNSKKPDKPTSLVDSLVVGTILSGDYKNSKGGYGAFTITITKRDGKKVEATYLITPTGGEPRKFTGDYEGEVTKMGLNLKSVAKAEKHAISLRQNQKGNALEGTYVNSTTGLEASVAFKLEE